MDRADEVIAGNHFSEENGPDSLGAETYALGLGQLQMGADSFLAQIESKSKIGD